MATYLVDKIADYVIDLKTREVPFEISKLVKERVLDSIATAIGALNSPPIKAIYNTLKDIAGKGSYGFGFGEVSPDQASFLNGCLVRYLDFNDTYLSKEALHPSDNIPGIWAVGEYVGVDGETFIKGIIASYELSCRLADASSIRNRGWDHVTYIAIASSVGASLILDLPHEKIKEAVNIATATNINLRQTRVGELSMWKGCAAGYAVRNGIFSALLARNGMTGPKPVFEGERGFFRQVSGEFTLEFPEDEYKIRETSIKAYPVEYHSMSAVEAVLRLRDKVEDISRIKKIYVDTFTVSYQIIVKDPEKWRPETKETADHSLPYIVATTLLDGYIWLDSYTEDKLKREDTLRLMDKMEVRVGEGFDNYYPKGIPNRITIELDDGRKFSELVIYPKGHFMNPMTRDELYNKYERLVKDRLSNYKDVWDLVWRLEKLSDIKELSEAIKEGLGK